MSQMCLTDAGYNLGHLQPGRESFWVLGFSSTLVGQVEESMMTSALVIASVAGTEYLTNQLKKGRVCGAHSWGYSPSWWGRHEHGNFRQSVTLLPPQEAERWMLELSSLFLFMESRTPTLKDFNDIHVCLPVSVNIISPIPVRHLCSFSLVTRSYQVENQQEVEPGIPQCIQHVIDANDENSEEVSWTFPKQWGSWMH